MFKNCVFKLSVDTKKWLMAALVRAVKTMAQAVIGVIGSSVALGEVDWTLAVSAAAVAGIASIATSVAGIPEVPEEG